MKTNQQTPSHSSSQSTPHGWLMPLIIAICAAGAGITGTLLWVQSRTPLVSSVTQSPLTPALPSTRSNDTPSAIHEPPADLTVGMTPAQSALTLGNWYYDHERWPAAMAQYQKAISGGLDNPDVRTDFGNALRFSGAPQKALEQYRIAQKQNPQHEHSLFNQGGVYAVDLKQPQKAIAVWRQYLQVFPNGQNVVASRQLIVEAQASLKQKHTP